MTELTVIPARHMGQMLSDGRQTVMTRKAVHRGRIMIELSPLPAPRSVAITTLIRAGNMVDRLRNGHTPHVAALAVIRDRGVIHSRRLPVRRRNYSDSRHLFLRDSF